jgi:hypothetical protein
LRQPCPHGGGGAYDCLVLPEIPVQVLFFNTTNSTVETIGFDAEGQLLENKTLMNATIPWIFSQNPNIMTDDDGFISVIVLYPDSKTNSPAGSKKISIGLEKLDINGKEVWIVTPITFFKPQYGINIQLKNLIQTSDGGYVILGLRDNFWKC